MDDKERYARGMSVRRKVLGAAWVDKQTAAKTAFNSEFQDLITRYPWCEVWTRPHFDERTRRILVIGTMIALGADRGGLLARRHQGDHPAADRLLRRAGRQPRVQGRGRDRKGARQGLLIVKACLRVAKHAAPQMLPFRGIRVLWLTPPVVGAERNA